jgi:hypothetical protein
MQILLVLWNGNRNTLSVLFPHHLMRINHECVEGHRVRKGVQKKPRTPFKQADRKYPKVGSLYIFTYLLRLLKLLTWWCHVRSCTARYNYFGDGFHCYWLPRIAQFLTHRVKNIWIFLHQLENTDTFTCCIWERCHSLYLGM